MKKYREYKDSGVEWIGQVPSEWEVKKSRYLFYPVSVKGNPDAELLSVYRDYGVIPRYSRDDNYNKPSLDLSGYKVVMKGDLVFNKMKAWQGSLGVSDFDGIVSPAYIVCKPCSSIYQKYFHHLYRSPLFISELGRLSYGIRVNQWDLRYEDFAEIPALFPPFEDQEAIAKYLDHKTNLIETLIEKKQKQIELLQEQRATIINQAVTKGLNPKVKMKDSGIEWLGGVPENWKRIQLKRVFSQIDYGISDCLSGNGDIKVLTMGNIQNGAVVIPEDCCINEVDPQLLLRQFDLLFNRTNSRDLVAKVGIYKNNIDEKVTFASYLVRFRTNGNNDSEYMNYLLNSNDFITYARSLALHSINQSNLNSTKYSQIVVYLPPKEEQIEITQYLENRCIVIEEMIQKVNKKIERLKEYRTTLISEVVTGKIDLRDEAIP